MATPCGGVLARTQALGLGGVENALNMTAKARSGLRLCHPDWLEHAQDIFGRDRVNRLHAQWRSVGFERHSPLLPVFVVSEALALFCNNLICQLAERRDALVLFAIGERGNAAARESSARHRLLAGLGEFDFGIAAQAHLASLALPKEAENPFLRPSRRDGQLQPATVAVLAGFSGF